MKNRMNLWMRPWLAPVAMVCVLVAAAPALVVHAQTRFLGAITAINGNTLTVKTSAGEEHTFQVPDSASIRRIEPGQTSLTNAATIPLSDLALGDRLLVLLNANSTGGTPQATEIVAIKHEDVVKRQEQESQAWSQGVGGLVESVDPATGTIVLKAGSGLTTKTVTVKTAPSTVLKRYAPASVSYADAKPAPIADIHSGDELLARGTKNADGTEIAAQEVVSGSFRNISGLISSIDASNHTIAVKDLLTKKDVTIDITPAAQMRRLPEHMAQFLAARLKGEAPGAGGGGRGNARPQGSGGGNGGGAMRREGPEMGQGARGEMNPQQILSRAPAITFSELKKGEAVMLVSTQDADTVTAITLVAGVEPLLEAPASQDLLSSWTMNSGSGAAESAGGGGDSTGPQ